MASKMHAALICMLLAACARASSYPTEVVTLTDATFEHDTQASTGQTTGIWCVLFTSRSDPYHRNVHAMWELLAANEEKDVVYAEVDVNANRKLAARFGALAPLPKAVLLRDRMMYVYDVPTDTTDGHENIMGFVMEGYQLLKAQQVPEPGSSFAGASDVEEMVKTQGIIYTIIAIVLILVMTIITRIIVNPRPSGMESSKMSKSAPAPRATSKPTTKAAPAKEAANGTDSEEEEEEEPTARRKKPARI